MRLVLVGLVGTLLLGLAPAPRASRAVGDLRYEVGLAKTAYERGEAVEVALRVANASGAPVAVSWGGQAYDVVVRQRGGLVWQWSHDKAFAQVMRQVSLPPGDALSYHVSWEQRDLQGRPVDPGVYDITGVFMATSREARGPVEVGPVRITIGRQ